MGNLPSLLPLASVAVFGLRAVFRRAYNTGILQVWYLSIDMHSTLSHVEFEDGLSVSVLKNRNHSPYKITAGNEKNLKKKAPPRFFQIFVSVAIGPHMSEFPR
jgi:hypothetical protein